MHIYPSCLWIASWTLQFVIRIAHLLYSILWRVVQPKSLSIKNFFRESNRVRKRNQRVARKKDCSARTFPISVFLIHLDMLRLTKIHDKLAWEVFTAANDQILARMPKLQNWRGTSKRLKIVRFWAKDTCTSDLPTIKDGCQEHPEPNILAG